MYVYGARRPSFYGLVSGDAGALTFAGRLILSVFSFDANRNFYPTSDEQSCLPTVPVLG